MEPQLEQHLIECLSALERGESVDSILSRYADDAPSLRPLLEVAVALPRLRLEPTPAAQAASRRAFLQAAQPVQPHRTFAWLPRFAAPLGAFLLVCALLTGGAVTAAATALPGDALYPVKRVTEELRLALTTDKAGLTKQFAQQHRDEIAALLIDGRAAVVEFDGIITTMQPTTWEVSGIAVQIAQTTQIIGFPAEGRTAHIIGRTERGQLLANQITISASDTAQPSTPTQMINTPLPRPTSVPEATQPPATALPSTTSTPTEVLTPTNVPTTRPTARPLPPPHTPIPREVPTVTPTSTEGNVPDQGNENTNDDHGGNGNENINENTNDNHGGGNENANENTNDNHGGGNENANENTNDSHGGGNENANENTNDNHGGGNENANNDNSGGGGGGDDDNNNTNDQPSDNSNRSEKST